MDIGIESNGILMVIAKVPGSRPVLAVSRSHLISNISAALKQLQGLGK